MNFMYFQILGDDIQAAVGSNIPERYKEFSQETIEALGGMDIMPKHSDICQCRYVCIFKLSFR